MIPNIDEYLFNFEDLFMAIFWQKATVTLTSSYLKLNDNCIIGKYIELFLYIGTQDSKFKFYYAKFKFIKKKIFIFLYLLTDKCEDLESYRFKK